MKPEALAWWRRRMELDPNHPECASCVHRVAGTLEAAAARSLLRKRFTADTSFQGSFAAGLANLAFQSGDLAGMETVLEQSR
ncbi:MAG: hypothetical protein GWO24_11990, partial [Akkermansiaceae bacterium]|nr:hypothetical protein [Akkermansiaceae bacterium]